MFDIKAALKTVIDREASDLHLKAHSSPLLRINGLLQSLEGAQELRPSDTEEALRELLLEEKEIRHEEFAHEGELDFAYELKGVGRFRVNAFRQRGCVSVVCRAIPMRVPKIDELGLPAVITALAEEERGIILCTGTTGSGKSTTLAAMIGHINDTSAQHVVTIEDPIEFLHEDNLSAINQREVGIDTASFARALRRVLRQDPDVILIGEMRDEETVRTALTAAETGHLVMSTIHTVDAVESVNRIVDFFPPHEQQQARVMLAGVLKGVISQRLVRTADGMGRVPACEILTMTGRARDMILKAEETAKLADVIAEGAYYGMQTFDQSLLALYQEGKISFEDALRTATRPHDFKLMVDAQPSTEAVTQGS